jgi:hypothetical protein
VRHSEKKRILTIQQVLHLAFTDELRGWAFDITLGVPLDQTLGLQAERL